MRRRGSGAEKIADAPRDCRRRIEKVDRPGREPPQALDQQRIMRAGEHDGIGARAVIAKARRDLGAKRVVADRRAVKLRLGIGGERLRSDQRDAAIAGIIADQRAGIFARDRRLGAEHGNAARRGIRASRLDRRHGADERQREFFAQIGQHDGRSGVAGDDDEIGPMRRDQLAHEIDDARDQRRLLHAAIGKGGVVGDIDEIGARPRRRDFAIDREPAEPGIEHQNGFRRGHLEVRKHEESVAGNLPSSFRGAREAASPESVFTDRWLWIPGSSLRSAPE